MVAMVVLHNVVTRNLRDSVLVDKYVIQVLREEPGPSDHQVGEEVAFFDFWCQQRRTALRRQVVHQQEVEGVCDTGSDFLSVESNSCGTSLATGPSSSTAAKTKPIVLRMGGTSQLQATQHLPLGSCAEVSTLSPCKSCSTNVNHQQRSNVVLQVWRALPCTCAYPIVFPM